jgi:hypothetical protein
MVAIASFANTSVVGAATNPTDSFGLVDPSSGIWQLYEGGQMAIPFYFGNPGDYPFMGDWDCDGIDTPGLYRQSDGYVYLRNSNTQGVADISFFFGNPGDVPIAGDFNANGCDTVSIYRPSEARFYIINELGTNDGGLGAAEYSFLFGNQGDKPFIADFNGNGQDTIGLHRESTGLVYYRNTNTQGNAHNQFIYGDPGDRLIAGDWTGNGIDSPGLFRPSNTTMYLRYQNSQGNADESWNVGDSSWLPVAGEFGPIPMPPPLAGGSGVGDAVVALNLPAERVVIEFSHDGSSNFAVWSLDQSLGKIDLLVNEIGVYDGTRPMQFEAGETVSNLEIIADGNWTYEIRSLDGEPRLSCPVTGKGDAIVLLPRFETASGIAALNHTGSSNFAIWAWGANDRDLLVNEIGAYSGSVVVSSGLYAWDIIADGDWTIGC